jgi:glycosyltransferase involved in cell wall biosynthesis
LVIQFFVALVNLVFSQPFPKDEKKDFPLVSVLIPARNEEKNIATLLDDIINQAYKNIEVIVLNDQSTDKTKEIVEQYIKNEERLKLINSAHLPAGWKGKNHACFTLAKHARGEYFLFLDADVRISGNIIRDTTKMMEKYHLGLLSIFPMQIMKTRGEYMTVPNMNFILLSLLPLILVRKSSFPSLSAANGQFMLFNADIYKKTAPHEKMKMENVEDIAISQYFKKNNIKIACLYGNNSIRCRMYKNVKEAIQGFARNVLMFFGNSPVLAILYFLFTTAGFFIVFFYLPVKFFVVTLVITILTRVFITVSSKQNVFKNLILAIPQKFMLGVFIYYSLRHKTKKSLVWKGRNVS